MVKLLIIADDFTGALDTGVQFSGSGVRTKVMISDHLELNPKDQCQVLVIDAESRHLSADRAYEILYGIVSAAVQAGIPYIYKKTDSALRGNIGSELTAALDASGARALSFVPSFPKMKRLTRDGVHYIDGVPVSKSIFSRDPFEPVTRDSVAEIIHLQKNTEVTVIRKADPETLADAKGILVFDADSDQAVKKNAWEIRQADLCNVMAGCAGFASALPEILGFEREEPEEQRMYPRLLMVCGSINPITVRQVEYGVRCGYSKYGMTPQQKLDPLWWGTDEAERLVSRIGESVLAMDCCILDSNDIPGTDATRLCAEEKHISAEEMRVKIAQSLGMAAKRLLEADIPAVFLVTGGDTLFGLMKQIGQSELEPLGEIASGVVLTRLVWKGEVFHIITKSGGFGEEGLLEQIVQMLKTKNNI